MVQVMIARLDSKPKGQQATEVVYFNNDEDAIVKCLVGLGSSLITTALIDC
jgi:hypothetical protein